MKKIMLLVLCFALVFTAGAFAGSNVVEAVLADHLNIKIFGQNFVARDDDGTVLQPLIYNGRTYLPVKAIVEKFGYEVGWEGKTSTITIDEKKKVGGIALSEVPHDLYQWELDADLSTYDFGEFDITKYNKIYVNDYDGGDAIKISHNSTYSTLNFNTNYVVLNKTKKSYGVLTVEDRDRNILLREIDLVKENNRPINVDISGTNNIVIRVNTSNMDVFLLDPVLTNDVTSESSAFSLNNQDLLNDEIPLYDMDFSSELIMTKDTQFLQNFKYGLVNDDNYSNKTSVDLNKGFKTFKASIEFLTINSDENYVLVKDEHDNIVAKEKATKVGIVPLEVDITGLDRIKIYMYNDKSGEVIIGEPVFIKAD